MNSTTITLQNLSKRLLQWTFYPFIVFGSTTLSIYLLQYFTPETYTIIPFILVLLVVGIISVSERLLPYRTDWNENKGDALTDGIQTFIVLPFASKIAEFILPLIIYYGAIWFTGDNTLAFWPQSWPLWAQLTLALLLTEFFYYWIHRLSHTLPLLWRFHAVHHGATRVYWLNSGRFHMIDAVIDSMFYLFPLIFMGASNEVMILIICISAITGFLEHVNIHFKAGYLNYLFNTAELHRWHHSIDREESNHNYGKVLIVWDLIFRTFYLPKNKEVKEVGISDTKEVPNNFWGQLIYPFIK